MNQSASRTVQGRQTGFPWVAILNRSQIATGSQKHRDPRYVPNVFTEHGAIMAASGVIVIIL